MRYPVLNKEFLSNEINQFILQKLPYKYTSKTKSKEGRGSPKMYDWAKIKKKGKIGQRFLLFWTLFIEILINDLIVPSPYRFVSTTISYRLKTMTIYSLRGFRFRAVGSLALISSTGSSAACCSSAASFSPASSCTSSSTSSVSIFGSFKSSLLLRSDVGCIGSSSAV
jgi:hypothetical protein